MIIKIVGGLCFNPITKTIFNSFYVNYSTAGRILNSGLQQINIPQVPIQDFVFENIAKWENHIATVSKKCNEIFS